MGIPNYPSHAALPPDEHTPPQSGFVDNANSYNAQGETDAVQSPDMRAPVDARVSKPEPTETKTGPAPRREALYQGPPES